MATTRRILLSAALAAGSWSSLFAQQEAPKIGGDTFYFQSAVTAPSYATTYNFVSREIDMQSSLVKGAPYSAEAVNETVQTLADGNRIVSKTTSARYRDKEGRTRQSLMLPSIGGYPPAEKSPQIVMIKDPVAGLGYTLDLKEKTATKLLDRKPDDATLADLRAKLATAAKSGSTSSEAGNVEFRTKLDAEAKTLHEAGSFLPRPTTAIRISGPNVVETFGAAPPATVEQLGQQTIEGVLATGTRTTSKIPAGQIGNERDIEIVSERWYSPELKMVIMTKHSDPRTAESTFRLTNIRRTDPDPSLFQVPADYTLKDPMQPMTLQIRTNGAKE